jgi:hypothetical protein
VDCCPPLLLDRPDETPKTQLHKSSLEISPLYREEPKLTNGDALRRTLCFGESSNSFIQFSFSFGRGSVELLNIWRFRLVAGGGFEPPTFGL